MKNKTDIRLAVFEILSDIAPEIVAEEDINVSANLRDEVDLDSMDFLNLLTAVSERLRVEIPEKDYHQLESFDDLVRYVEQRCEGR